MDQYRIFDEAGTWETAYIFRFDNGCLTMNSEGRVFTTDTLDEGCIWLIVLSTPKPL